MEPLTCVACEKNVEGAIVDWDANRKVIDANFKSAAGFRCRECGTVFCRERSDGHPDFSLWSGYAKSSCPVCGASLALGDLVFDRAAAVKAGLVEAAEVPESDSSDAQSQSNGTRFEHPQVEDAYQPSGKVTVLGLLFMGVLGLFGAAMVGGLVMGGDQLGSGIMSVAAGGADGAYGSVLVLLAALVLYFFVGVGAGWVEGMIIGKGAQWGRFRNRKWAAVFGLLGGVVVMWAYVSMRRDEVGIEAFDSTVDYIKVSALLIAVIPVAMVKAHQAVGHKPFCEPCRRYMKRALAAAFPINQEGQVLELLREADFDSVMDLADPKYRDQESTELWAWYCDKCDGSGYLDAWTTHTWPDPSNSNKTKEDSRLVHSSKLEPNQVKMLVGT